MAKNTCKSIIQYQNHYDAWIDGFSTDRREKAFLMYEEGKTASWPNTDTDEVPPGHAHKRAWVDWAAAQEFIDFVVATAPNYQVTIISTAIEDLDQ
jgi:hypothetical protein